MVLSKNKFLSESELIPSLIEDTSFLEDQSISENLFKILNESPSDNIGQHGFFGVHYFAS